MKIYGIIILLLLLSACSKGADHTHTRIVVAKPSPTSQRLFYAGIIQPYKTVVVASPVEGVVVETDFQYGQAVKSGQLLFKISSTKFLADYKTALLQYVKAKSELNTAQTQLNEATFLHKNQLISEDDFKMKQSGFYGARLALLQSRDALENLLHQLNVANINFDELRIANINKIEAALHGQLDAEYLSILSPVEGIVLAQTKNTQENTKTRKGDVVKQGDVLAVIGNMQGLSVEIKVNELTLNQLRMGQEVKVSGIAFPEDILSGRIVRIDKQGDIAGGGLPTFNVQVRVNKLTRAQQKNIHVGMSAKIEMNLVDDPHITIPLSAIKEKNGQAWVSLWDTKSHQVHEVMVQTGKTTPEAITILAGLKEGDTLVLPH